MKNKIISIQKEITILNVKLNKPFATISQKLIPHNKSTVNEVRHLVTLACNLSCDHCYEKGMTHIQTRLFSQEEANRFYHYFQPESVSATGGEPLLFPDLVRKLAIATASYGGELELVTNAWYLTKKFAEELREINPKTYFQISLDGPQKYHDALRHKEGAHAKAIEAINMVSTLGMKAKARMTVMQENKGYIPELIQTLEGLANPGKIKLVMREALQYGGAKENGLGVGDDHVDLERMRQLIKNIGISLTDKCGNCEDSLTVDPQGGIVPCCYFIGDKKYYIGDFYNPESVTKHPDFVNFSTKCRAMETFHTEEPGAQRCSKCVSEELITAKK